ncbi:MAG: ABC transporter ATP-binding protein [Pseudomonadota bacterium]
MIRLDNIHFAHKAVDGSHVPTLENICLHINKNEFVSIVGPSGCGKTTLLEIMAGLKIPDVGKIEISCRKDDRKFGWAGYMSQADTLLPWRTVARNVQIGLEIRKVTKNKYKSRVAGLIRKVGLEGTQNRYPSELSGGMKKRVDLIRALAYDPEVLLLDEPFGALDAQTREKLQQDLLSLWRDDKKTIVFVTHDLIEAIMLSDRIIMMSSRPSGIIREFRVKVPRPRHYHVQFSDEFIILHKKIRQLFIEQAGENK